MISNMYEILCKFNKFWYCSEDFEDLKEQFCGDTTTFRGNKYKTDLIEYRYQANPSQLQTLLPYPAYFLYNH